MADISTLMTRRAEVGERHGLMETSQLGWDIQGGTYLLGWDLHIRVGLQLAHVCRCHCLLREDIAPQRGMQMPW